MAEKKLRIAIQKSGRLNEDSLRLIKDCGIAIDNGEDQLKVTARNFPLELFFLRNSDIPQYIEDGVADIAIIGENELSPADRADYAKAKKLIANFSQNMNVMTKHNGVPGDYFTREETLKSIEEIII